MSVWNGHPLGLSEMASDIDSTKPNIASTLIYIREWCQLFSSSHHTRNDIANSTDMQTKSFCPSFPCQNRTLTSQMVCCTFHLCNTKTYFLQHLYGCQCIWSCTKLQRALCSLGVSKYIPKPLKIWHSIEEINSFPFIQKIATVVV